VSEARIQAYVKLYRKLDTKEGKNNVYEMTKFRERKTRDFNQVKCIKDETDMILVKDDEIKKDGENTSTSCSTTRMRKSRSSWTTQLMIPTGDLFGEFKSLRWKKLRSDG
jgi:hypothetical protein